MPSIGGGLAIALAAIAAAAAPAYETPKASSLAVFTLVRGSSSEGEAGLDSFIHSRRCLREAMPAWSTYDDIAFHEGNVPLEVQRALRKKM
jgi:hypothetical protein